MTSWKDVPKDIAHLILDKLPEAIEHVRFGAVSIIWHAISREYQRLHNSRRALPMLLVPSPNAPAKREPPRLYALSSLGQHYQNIRHGLPFSSFRYCGSSNGWLATQNEDFTITLRYPFGSELRTIHLPRLRYERGMRHDFHTCKLIVSPESTIEDYTVVVLFGDLNRLATIKSGEESWTLLHPLYVLFDDIIFFNKKVYGVCNFFAVVEVDIEVRPLRSKIIHQKDESLRYYSTYLVESSSSEIFVVGRLLSHTTLDETRALHEVADQTEGVADEYTLDDDEYDNSDEDGEQEEYEELRVYTSVYMTRKFNVFKLKLDQKSGEVLELVESKHLGGDTFFVGDNESISFPSRSFPGCKSNAIYFTDDVIHIQYYEPNGPEDVGCYNVEDESISRFYTMNPCHKRNMPQPIWIMPRYH